MTAIIHLPLFWLVLFCVALLFANLWLFLRREWEASHRGVDYAQLYFPADLPTIRRWRFGVRQLIPVLVWNKRPEQWELFIDGQSGTVLPGHAPRIELTGEPFNGAPGAAIADHAHQYVLRPLPVGSGPELRFTITEITRDYYAKNHMHFPRDLVRINTEVPVGRFRRRPLRDWTDDYRYLGRTALARAHAILRDEIHLAATDDVQTRIEKIVCFMRTALVEAGGVPKDDFRWQDPLTIFETMRSGGGKGWCTQNAQIFTFFANLAGVATRFVSGATMQANVVVYNGHSWSECWLPEQNRWTYVDPQSIICGVFDARGRALNSADLLHLCRHNAFDGVTARTFKNWRWRDLPVDAPPDQPVTVPFALVNATAKAQATEQTIIKYRLPPNVEDVRDLYSMLLKSRVFAWTNLKRYLGQPVPAYSLYPTEGAGIYRQRQWLFAAFVASLFCLIASIF